MLGFEDHRACLPFKIYYYASLTFAGDIPKPKIKAGKVYIEITNLTSHYKPEISCGQNRTRSNQYVPMNDVFE